MKYKIIRYINRMNTSSYTGRFVPPRTPGYDVLMRGNTREINGRRAYFLNKYGHAVRNVRKLGN